MLEPANDGNFGVPENATLDCLGCHPGNQTPTKYLQGNQQSDDNTTTRTSYCQLATNAVNAVTAATTIANTGSEPLDLSGMEVEVFQSYTFADGVTNQDPSPVRTLPLVGSVARGVMYTYRMIVGTDFSYSGHGYSSCRQ